MIQTTIKLMILGMFLVTLLSFALCSGCRIVQPVLDFVFKPPASSSEPTSPTSPEGRLLDAVKGVNWLVTLSVLGIAAGVFALLNGSKIGIPVIVSCAVALFMSLAVARYATWMAIFGLVGSVLVVAVSILAKNKALKEIVSNVQVIKKVATSNGNVVSQEEIEKTLKNQAKSTQKLVAKIKKSLT